MKLTISERAGKLAVLISLLATLCACREDGTPPLGSGHDAHAAMEEHEDHDDHPAREDDHGDERHGSGEHDGEEHDGDEHDAAGHGGDDDHADHDAHEEGIVELSPEALEAAGISTVRAEERALSAGLETTGQVGYDETRVVHVGPRIPGRIHEVRADLGATVEAGALLASLDSIELGQAKAALLQARARLDAAEQAHEREQTLLADGISTEQQRIEAEASERVARAEVEAARETLRLYGLTAGAIDGLTHGESESSHFPIRAPLAGTVVERHAAVGEYVTPERSLFRLADLGHLWIWIDVYERDLSRVNLGDRVRVGVDAIPDRSFEGEVSYLASEVDPDTRTIRARIDVVNDEGLLRPGMFTRVQLSGGSRTPGSPTHVVVPVSAVQRLEDEQLVFVQEGERRFEVRDVKTGTRSGESVEILEGVRAGELVVIEGGFVLKSELGKGEMGGGHSH